MPIIRKQVEPEYGNFLPRSFLHFLGFFIRRREL
nr:MAG TPA: hypothetical protein [Caudoviricetes sp.]